MTADHLKGIAEFEARLWKIADTLRANANVPSNEYFMPLMGLLFLRQATNQSSRPLPPFVVRTTLSNRG